MKLTKFEHAALCVEQGGQRIAVDPGCLTSDSSRIALRGVAAVIISHRHADHFDEQTLKDIGAPVYGPPEVVKLALARGFVAEPLYLNVEKEVAGFGLTAVAANHGPMVATPVENYGFVIRSRGSTTLYITGDVAGVQMAAAPIGHSAVVVPIEGGGFVFGPQEAAAFLRGIAHTGVAIGVHTDDAAIGQDFVSAVCGACDARFLRLGETIAF